jgi:hypothetical protein
VSDVSAIDGSAYNPCATLSAHPLGEAYGRRIYGNALLVPLKGSESYTLEDWQQICDGVWYKQKLVEKNAKSALAFSVRV